MPSLIMDISLTKLSYLTLPVNLQYGYDFGALKIIGQAGVYAGYALNGKVVGLLALL